MVTMKGSSFLSGIGPHRLLYPAYLCHYPISSAGSPVNAIYQKKPYRKKITACVSTVAITTAVGKIQERRTHIQVQMCMLWLTMTTCSSWVQMSLQIMGV